MNIAKAGNPHKEPSEWRCHRNDRKRDQGCVTGKKDTGVLELQWNKKLYKTRSVRWQKVRELD